jgi:hypothetical protein
LLSEELRRESLAATLEWLSGSLPKADYNEADWNLWKRLAPHLDAVVESSERCNMENQALSLLCSQYGLWLYYQARHEMSEPLMRRALGIDEKSFGADHPNVAIDLNNLAQLLQATNRLGEAELLMRRALTALLKFTRTTGHMHPHIRSVFGNYAGLLKKCRSPTEKLSGNFSNWRKAPGWMTRAHARFWH